MMGYHPLRVLFVLVAAVDVSAKQQLKEVHETFKIVEGFLTGFGVDVKDTEKCVSDSVELMMNVGTAVTMMERRTKDTVYLGLKILGYTLIDVLPDTMLRCHASEESISKITQAVQLLAAPSSFAYTIGKHIIVNGVDIFRDVNGAIASWKKAKGTEGNDKLVDESYQQFGVQLGDATRLIVVGMAKADDFQVAMNNKTDPPILPIVDRNIVEFMKGLLLGFGVKSVPTGCVNEAKLILETSTDEVQRIVNGQEKDVQKAIKELQDKVRDMIPMLEADCAYVGVELQSIMSKVETQYPTEDLMKWHIAQDVVKNGPAIGSKLNESQQFFSKRDFEKVGESWGSVVRLVLVGDDTEGKVAPIWLGNEHVIETVFI